MDRALVHFELFVRRHRAAPWELTLATEDRRTAFSAADEVLAGARGAAVRLLKETRDPASGEYRPLVIMERGDRTEPRQRRSAMRATPPQPSCARPQDLYASPAREAIGRFLSGWLRRHRVTPFELLHRPDLAERLEACEAELSVALYNAALAEAAARAAPLEPIQQALQSLVRRTFDHVMGDDHDIAFRFGVAVASRLGRQPGWKDKIELVLELIEAAPDDGPPANVSMRVLQQPLIDILGGQADLEDILDGPAALGEQLLMLTQICSAPAIAAVAAQDGALARVVPRLKGLAAHLAMVLHGRSPFVRARRAIGRRVLTLLSGEDRLWPDDPVREVEGLKALGVMLSVSGRLLDQDDVRAALARRWRRIAGPAFLDARLSLCTGEVEEADLLVDLIDAAVGRAAGETLARRLTTVLAGRAFEQEVRFSPDPAPVCLKRLAGLAGPHRRPGPSSGNARGG